MVNKWSFDEKILKFMKFFINSIFLFELMMSFYTKRKVNSKIINKYYVTDCQWKLKYHKYESVQPFWNWLKLNLEMYLCIISQ